MKIRIVAGRITVIASQTSAVKKKANPSSRKAMANTKLQLSKVISQTT
jgi:hypothetical protein